MIEKIGLGGGCHWCTEGVFQTLTGVQKVEQGWISAKAVTTFSEAVIVYFDSQTISLKKIIKIHLHTHSCTSTHNFRDKYRSAVYVFNQEQNVHANLILASLAINFDSPTITEVLDFAVFKLNQEQYLDYYKKNPDKPFCQVYIAPKIKRLAENFPDCVKSTNI